MGLEITLMNPPPQSMPLVTIYVYVYDTDNIAVTFKSFFLLSIFIIILVWETNTRSTLLAKILVRNTDIL